MGVVLLELGASAKGPLDAVDGRLPVCWIGQLRERSASPLEREFRGIRT